MLTLRAGGTWSTTGITGGVWLHGLAFVGDIKFTTIWSGGFGTMSFRMRLPKGYSHAVLRNGSLVELFDGSRRVGYGIMAEPDREAWTFTVDGMALVMARGRLALDGAYAPTTNPTTAITQAAARGCPISVGTGVPNTSLSTLSEAHAEVNYIPTLFDAHADNLGQRWRIDSNGAVSFAADPAAGSIDWIITPGVPGLATAEDDYASLVAMRYVSAVTGSEPSAWSVTTSEDTAAAARWGAREVYEDQTELGLLTALQATANAAAIRTAKRARPAYTQGVELASFQITTTGGVPAHLPSVRAGQRVRQYGVIDADGSGSTGTAEWVIGGTEYVAGSRVITITPVGLAPRTAAKVIQGLRAKQEQFS